MFRGYALGRERTGDMVKRWFVMTRRKALLCALAWIASVVLHNALSVAFRSATGGHGDEPFFFLIAVVVIPAYVVITLTYTLVTRFSKPA